MLLGNPIQVRYPCEDHTPDVRRRKAGPRRVYARDVGILEPGTFKALDILPVQGFQFVPAIFLVRAGADNFQRSGRKSRLSQKRAQIQQRLTNMKRRIFMIRKAREKHGKFCE